MSEFFTKAQQLLQSEFETTSLANRIEEAVVMTELSDQQSEFIHNRNMFYLSTTDELGYPSCSYKGGHPGFVRVLNSATIVFPNYDGNGMFMSMGNIEAKVKVGLLFIDFETPQRLRLRGSRRRPAVEKTKNAAGRKKRRRLLAAFQAKRPAHGPLQTKRSHPMQGTLGEFRR